MFITYDACCLVPDASDANYMMFTTWDVIKMLLQSTMQAVYFVLGVKANVLGIKGASLEVSITAIAYTNEDNTRRSRQRQ